MTKYAFLFSVGINKSNKSIRYAKRLPSAVFFICEEERKPHMRSPLNTLHRVTSPYGNRTLGGKTEMHNGIDLVPQNGVHPCTIYAPFAGKVTEIRNTIPDSHTGLLVNTYVTGNYVNIVTDNGYTLIFRHLRYGSICVKVGQTVKAGDMLGVMGSTGQSTGIHLHYEIRDKKGASVDPAPYIGNDKLPWANVTAATVVATPAASVSTPAQSTSFKVGDRVKVKQGAKTYTGGSLASFVYNTVYDVQQVSGDRVVIGVNGIVTAAVKMGDLTLKYSS